MSDSTRIERIEDKIDKLLEHAASQATALQEHKRRIEEAETKLALVEGHVTMAKGAAKLLAIVGGLAGLLISALSLKGK